MGESKNTLRSKAVARFIDVISEGPCVGVVGGLEGIYLDRTPVANAGVAEDADNRYNFQGIKVRERRGYPDQSFIKGFPHVENPEPVNVEVKFDQPITREIQNGNLDAVRIKVKLPSLNKTESDGDIKGTKVELQVYLKSNGGTYKLKHDMLIEGKCTSPYERDVRINLPQGGAPWTIKLVRVTEDADTIKLQNKTFFDSYTEIIDARLRYPDTALAGFIIDAEQFGANVPERRFKYRGRISQVPSNYDPETRTYTGFWDGTFKLAWHNNPAWVFWDLCTAKRYGLGDHIPQASIDKFGLYTIGQYCDGLVPDGKGGQEPRYVFNGVIRDSQDAQRVLDAISAVFRGMIYWGAGAVVVTHDGPGTPEKLVNQTNVLNGEFAYSGTPASARHSSVAVSWADPEQLGDTAVTVVQNDKLIQKFGDRRKRIAGLGCTSRGQANRLAEWVLYTEEYESETVTYRAALDHADVRPGQIIAIADPSYAAARYGGRVLDQVNGNEFTLDSTILMEAGEDYTISVVGQSGTVYTLPLNRVVGQQDVVKASAGAVPQGDRPIAGAVFVVTSTNVEPRLFRVLANIERAPNEYEITALIHHPGKYDYIDRDKRLVLGDFILEPSGTISGVNNLTAKGYHRSRAGTTGKFRILASWEKERDGRVKYYEVFLKEPDKDRVLYAQTRDTFLEIDPLDDVDGTYGVFVRVVAYNGATSTEASAEVDFGASKRPVEPPTNWFGISSHDHITLKGDEHPAKAFKAFHIYGAGVGLAATRLGVSKSPHFTRPVQTGDLVDYYYVTAVTQDGRESAPTSQIAVFPTPAGLDDLAQNVRDTIDAALQEAEDARDRADQAFERHDVALAEATGGLAELRDDADARIRQLREDAEAAIGSLTDTPIRNRVRSAEDALDDIYDSLIGLQGTAQQLDQKLIDAGIYVDPETGVVRIAAVHAAENRAASAEIKVDALEGVISQKASVAYVNGVVSSALLDPTQIPVIDALELRLTNAEQTISAEDGRITQITDTLTVDGGLVNMTEVVADLNSLEGALALKVDTSTFTDVEARLANAEVTLSTVEGASITQLVEDTRLLYVDMEKITDDTIVEMVERWKTNEIALEATAQARQDLRAYVDENFDSVATLTTELQAQVGNNVALLKQEAVARASLEAVFLEDVTTLAGQVEDANGVVADLLSLDVTADALKGTALATLIGEIGDVSGEITSIQNLTLDPNTAFGAFIDKIEVEFGNGSGGRNSFIEEVKSAQATKNRLANAYVLRQKAGGGLGTVQAVVADGENEEPISTFKIAYDDIDLAGRVSAQDLVVTDFTGNMIQNGSLTFNDFRSWYEISEGIAIRERSPDNPFVAIRTAPKPHMVEITPSDDAARFAYLAKEDIGNDGELYVEFSYARKGGGGYCDVFIRVQFFDADGAFISKDTEGVTCNSTDWKKFGKSVKIPATAARVEMDLRVNNSGGTAPVLVTRMKARRKGDAATLITPQSVTSNSGIFEEGAIGNFELGEGAVEYINIGEGEVDTLSINGDAVTVPVDEKNGATIRLYQHQQKTLAELNIKRKAGFNTRVRVGFDAFTETLGKEGHVYIGIYRNNVEIEGTVFQFTNKRLNTTENRFFTGHISVTTVDADKSGGTVTYSAKATLTFYGGSSTETTSGFYETNNKTITAVQFQR